MEKKAAIKAINGPEASSPEIILLPAIQRIAATQATETVSVIGLMIFIRFMAFMFSL